MISMVWYGMWHGGLGIPEKGMRLTAHCVEPSIIDTAALGGRGLREVVWVLVAGSELTDRMYIGVA